MDADGRKKVFKTQRLLSMIIIHVMFSQSQLLDGVVVSASGCEAEEPKIETHPTRGFNKAIYMI